MRFSGFFPVLALIFVVTSTVCSAPISCLAASPSQDDKAMREALDYVKAQSLLQYASSQGKRELIRNLLVGNSAEAKRLLAAGESPKGTDVLCAALSRPDHASYKGNIPDPDLGLLAELIRNNDVNTCHGIIDDTPLFNACRAGMDVTVVKMLVEAGANVDPYADKKEKARPGYVPHGLLLCNALRGARDNPEVVEYLLGLGISPTEAEFCGGNASSMLDIAAAENKPRSARVLIGAGADPRELLDRRRSFALSSGIYDENGQLQVKRGENQTDTAHNAAKRQAILVEAAKRHQDALFWWGFYEVAPPEDVRKIIGGRSLQGIRTLTYQEDAGSYSQSLPLPFGELLEGSLPRKTRTVEYQTTPLIQAARHTPYPEVIGILAEAGCNVRDLESKALKEALLNPAPEVLEAVLRLKPDLGVLNDSDWKYDITSQQFAFLLAAGVDINAGADKTPLIAALDGENLPLARALLQAGADMNRGDKKGDRALSYAVREQYFSLARQMIEAGAEGIYKNNEGHSLLQTAEREASGNEQNMEYQALMQTLRNLYNADDHKE